MTDRRIPDAELDAIEARARAASMGPWQSFVEGRDHHGGDNFIRVGGFDDDEADMYVAIARRQSPADLDFIAGARRDIPRLIEEIRRLRSELNSR